MADRKFSAFTNNPTRSPLDTLVGLDVSAAAAAQNSYWTLNTLFSQISDNTTDGSIRWGGVSAPAVSAAGKGSLYFDSGSNTFKFSQNTGAYVNLGNITTTGFTSTRVPVANGANTLIDDAGLTYNTTTDILTVGTTTGGGIGLVGSTGFSNVLASQAPAATLLTYWPNAAPTAGQFLYAATVGAQVQLGYQTAPSGSGSSGQVAVWGASNALSGSSALTFSTTPTAILSVLGAVNNQGGFFINQTTSGTAAEAGFYTQTTSSAAYLVQTSALFTPANLRKANQVELLAGTGSVEMLFNIADASRSFVWGMNNAAIASLQATASENLVLGVASSLTGRIKLYNSGGATYTQISSGNAAANLNYILPATSPTSGQVLSAAAPSGSNVTLSWASASGSLTATQVGFGDGSNVLSGSADFIYTTATGRLDINKAANSSAYMAVTNTSNGTAAQARFGATADVVAASLAAYSSGFTTSGLITANTALLDLDAPNALIKAQTGQNLTFAMGNTGRLSLTDTTFAVVTSPTTGNGFSVAASTVTSGNLASLSMTGTAAASNTKTALAIASSGANSTATQTVFGSTISVTNTGTTNTNIALRLTASGAATANTALNITAGALLTAGTITQTSASATAFESGPNGSTNPVFRLVNSTASSATGISVTGAAAGSGATIAAISSGSNENLFFNALGTGSVITVSQSATAIGFISRGAAAQSASILEVQDSTSSSVFFAKANGENYGGLGISLGGPGFLELTTTTAAARSRDSSKRAAFFFATPGYGLYFASDLILGWSSNAAGAGDCANNLDTGLARQAAGVVRITNGSTGAGSLVLGTSTVGSIGTSGVGVLAIANGTAPSSSPADEFQLYSKDAAAGDANAFIRNEAGNIARLTGNIAYVTTQYDIATSTTLATVTGSTVNVEAGLRYSFKANVFLDAGAVGGIKLSVGGTATATSVIFQTFAVQNTTTAFAYNTRQTALDGATTAVGATGYWAQIWGTIVVNAAGTLGLRFAQAVSDGTNCSVLVGSSFQIWQS